MFSLETYLPEGRVLVDATLDKKMPQAKTRPAILHEAMRYSVFSGGKRLRPILCLAACEAVGGKKRQALVPACALELLHTYTLIHDDLPAMDDDDERRGKPTCHVKFGEANAILAGDALLTLTFEWLADFPLLAKELAQATGSQGTVAGQVEDLASRGVRVDEKLLRYIHLNKTAKLIQAAVRIGALIGQAEPAQLKAISEYGEKIGLAFQLVDDALDEHKKGELTALAVYGRDGALSEAKDLVKAAVLKLRNLPGPIEPLEAIARFIVERNT